MCKYPLLVLTLWIPAYNYADICEAETDLKFLLVITNPGSSELALDRIRMESSLTCSQLKPCLVTPIIFTHHHQPAIISRSYQDITMGRL